MSKRDFGWAIPIMRAGYAGRGVVYTVVAGFALYATLQGRQAEGTSGALAQLEGTNWGSLVLFLIFTGMIAYAVWRLVDAAYDLENYGSDGEAVIARLGMITTGLIHLAIGVLAFLLLFTDRGGDGAGSSTISEAVRAVFAVPAGVWIVGLGGVVTIGAGIYYVAKAIRETYRDHLRANRFTVNWNGLLKAGVLSQGLIVTLIGIFLTYAAYTADASQAGGVGDAFGWVRDQAYGQILMIATSLGLLCFGLFCFVNARHRIVPAAAGDDIETLAQRLRAKTR